jgi:hypothetical protein
VVRLLSVALFITAACLAWCIAARSHAGIAGRVLLVATLVVYASPVAHFASVYSSLAVVCAMATMWSALRWLDARERRAGLRKAKRGLPPVGWLWGSGIAAGASIASKPNTGALALGALLVTVVVARRDALSAVREAAHIVLAATLLCAATIVPVVLNGAFSSFVSDVLLEKGDYVRVMSTSPVPGLGRTLSILHGTARSTAAHPLAAADHRGPLLGGLAQSGTHPRASDARGRLRDSGPPLGRPDFRPPTRGGGPTVGDDCHGFRRFVGPEPAGSTACEQCSHCCGHGGCGVAALRHWRDQRTIPGWTRR